MPSAHNTHSQRLRSLKHYFHQQEQSMTRALAELQEQLDTWEDSNDRYDVSFRRELSEERDELAAEISHVRMAIAGTDDELTAHEGHLRLLASIDPTETLADTSPHELYELLGA
jgi:chromosome segregation ATPase